MLVRVELRTLASTTMLAKVLLLVSRAMQYLAEGLTDSQPGFYQNPSQGVGMGKASSCLEDASGHDPPHTCI